MKGLAKSRVSKAALLGVLFFSIGCGSKDEENPPNYVVKEVQTGTTAESAQGVTEVPEDNSTGQETVGNSSIVREEIVDNAARDDTADGQEDAGENRKDPQESNGAEIGDTRQNDIGTMKEDAKSGQEDTGTISGQEDAVVGNAGAWQEESGQKDGGAAEKDVGIAHDGLEPQDDFESPGNAATEEQVNVMSVDELSLLPAGTIVDIRTFSEEELAACFYFEEVPKAVFERMKGNSYSEDCTVALSELCYVRVLHYGFDGAVHIGELVVNRAIARDIKDIFRELFDVQYPIEKMVLIDTYGGDDNASMSDNNTSSFNFRVVEGTTSLSKHAYGLAIDINPLYNPYIPVRDGVAAVLPVNGEAYVDRETECEYYIRHGDVCYNAFISRGFTWGGDWATEKDYQHFSKVIE